MNNGRGMRDKASTSEFHIKAEIRTQMTSAFKKPLKKNSEPEFDTTEFNNCSNN